jgi:hypothetical protein
MAEKFYVREQDLGIPDELLEQVDANTKKQTRFVFYIAIIALLFFGSICYDSTSITGFFIYVFVAGLFLYGLLRFNKRVNKNQQTRNEEKSVLPAEELFLSEKGINWEIKKSTPEKTVIAWENLIGYKEGILEHNSNGRKETTKIPRIIFLNHAVFIEYLEKNTQLQKKVKKQYIQNEEVDIVYYTK